MVSCRYTVHLVSRRQLPLILTYTHTYLIYRHGGATELSSYFKTDTQTLSAHLVMHNLRDIVFTTVIVNLHISIY